MLTASKAAEVLVSLKLAYRLYRSVEGVGIDSGWASTVSPSGPRAISVKQMPSGKDFTQLRMPFAMSLSLPFFLL